ncbi:MAG: sensor histidine kinase [Gemmatimonadales bacterium]
MKFATRLVVGMFSIVLLTILILAWGTRAGVPGVVAIALIIALITAWIAGRSIARPLVALAAAARDIAAGATPRFPRSGIPEVDTLVQALRRLHGDLAARMVELQRQRAGGDTLIDAMVEGVIAADARGHIVAANPAARRLLGYAPDAPLPELPALFRSRTARTAVARVLRGEDVHDVEVNRDGKTLALNARRLPEGALLVLHDLTEMRRLEAVRRDFVANVSHELKTPLTSIAGYAETLADPSIDAATRDRFLAIILGNARRMQRLVDDLLELSRIESGRWSPRTQSTDLGHLVADVWEQFRGRSEARGISFAPTIATDASRAVLDPDALRQILANLLDNALRYVPAGGHIALRAVRSESGVSISVQDDGAGIPREHLGRIFERFYRVDPARSREEGGTGLGLAIVRHLVEAHGGYVDVESELQHGTTIRAWFPGTTDE